MSAGAAMSVALDAVIVVLLAATIGYAYVLNRKLGALRGTKGEMEALVARLVEATVQAQQGLSGMRQHAEAAGQQMQRGIEAARGQANQLRILIERADAVVAAAQGPVGGARPKPGAAPGDRAAARGRAAAAPPPNPGAPEAELLKALRGLR